MAILELIVAGVIGAVAAGATVAIIRGIITRAKIRSKMRSHGIRSAIITAVNECTNTVTLESLMNGKTIELQGDGIGYDVEYNDVIVV